MVRGDGTIFRQSTAPPIDPDSVDAYGLGTCNVIYQVVTDHPRLCRGCLQLVQRVVEHPGVGFGDAKFPTNQDGLKEGFQGSTLDFCPLFVGIPIADSGQLYAPLAERSQGI